MSNKIKFESLVSGKDTKTTVEIKKRVKNREMLRESMQIAIKVLSKLDELGWTQKQLASKLEVSPQQVTKIVSGKENLTIETQVKLQTILNIPILATYSDNHLREKTLVANKLKRVKYRAIKGSNIETTYQSVIILRKLLKNNETDFFELAK